MSTILTFGAVAFLVSLVVNELVCVESASIFDDESKRSICSETTNSVNDNFLEQMTTLGVLILKKKLQNGGHRLVN